MSSFLNLHFVAAFFLHWLLPLLTEIAAGAQHITALELSRQFAAEAASYVRLFGFDSKIRVLPLYSKEADLPLLAAEARQRIKQQQQLLQQEQQDQKQPQKRQSGGKSATPKPRRFVQHDSGSSNSNDNNDDDNDNSNINSNGSSDSEKGFDLLIHEIIGDICSNEGVADVILDIQKRTGGPNNR